MPFCIYYNLSGLIKPHRHAIKQCTSKNFRMVTFYPGRNIDKQGKTGGMALRKTIASKAFQLFKNPLSKIQGISVSYHTLDQLFFKICDSSLSLECSHTAT